MRHFLLCCLLVGMVAGSLTAKPTSPFYPSYDGKNSLGDYPQAPKEADEIIGKFLQAIDKADAGTAEKYCAPTITLNYLGRASHYDCPATEGVNLFIKHMSVRTIVKVGSHGYPEGYGGLIQAHITTKELGSCFITLQPLKPGFRVLSISKQ